LTAKNVVSKTSLLYRRADVHPPANVRISQQIFWSLILSPFILEGLGSSSLGGHFKDLLDLAPSFLTFEEVGICTELCYTRLNVSNSFKPC